jgi:hypothetical protein
MRIEFPEYKIPVNGKWMCFSNKDVEAMPPSQREMIDQYIADYQLNPLAYSLVHGKARADGTNDGLAMVNDYESNLILLTAGNQQGKAQPVDTKHTPKPRRFSA